MSLRFSMDLPSMKGWRGPDWALTCRAVTRRKVIRWKEAKDELTIFRSVWNLDRTHRRQCKMRLLKKLTCKGTSQKVFICLRPRTSSPPYTLYSIREYSAGIFKQSIGARNHVGIGLSFWPARLHRLAELIPWNQFRGFSKVKKFGLSILRTMQREG